MICPNCGEKTKVVDSSKAPEETYRKRKCKACGHKFCTIEYEVEFDQNFKNQWAKYNRAWIRYRNKTSEVQKC